VGVGDAFTARYHHACLLFESSGERLLVDAPPALSRALHDLGARGGEVVTMDSIDRVLITHLHGDHVGGLEQLLYWRRFVTGRKCAVYAIPEVLEHLWDQRLRGGMEWLMDKQQRFTRMSLDDYCDVHPLEGERARVGPFELEWRRTIHHVPTSALRVRAGGERIAYSADTAFDRSLVAWLADSALFFHECNLGVHTPLEELLTVEPEARARMRLIHYTDFHPVDESPIPCAREGERYEC
jgi:ribonuclease BN (tRNA processing enzyme)